MERRQFLLGVGAVAGAAVINRLAEAGATTAAARRTADSSPSGHNLAFTEGGRGGQPMVRAVDSVWNPAVDPGSGVPARAEPVPVESGAAPSPPSGIQVPRELRAAGVPVFGPVLPPALRPQPVDVLAGPNLEGWEVVVGDGIWASEGEAPVGRDDIATDHREGQSLVRANIGQRAIMAHNITFGRIEDENALAYRHFGQYQFRLPHPLTTEGGEFSAQTVEGGLFIWDGAGERLEHGVGFQWTVNPWSARFGHVKTWTNDGWVQAGYLKPDREWHTLSFELNPASKYGRICLDAQCVDGVYTRFGKPDSWGSDVSARLQVEIISLDPGGRSSAPEHQVEVRDWLWEWS